MIILPVFIPVYRYHPSGVTIFQQMTCFFAAKTSPNMIGLTVKNIIIKKQLKKKFKVPGDLFCTIFGLSQCRLAGLLDIVTPFF